VDLRLLGWNDSFAAAFAPLAAEGLAPARVTAAYRERWRVHTGAAEPLAVVRGKLRYEAGGPQDLPVAGDWVAVEAPDGDSEAVIHAVLPRRSQFSRRAAGERTEEQVLAANIDTVFLVSGLDGDYNLRRIERYLTAAWDSGARPVVLLNKADVCPDAASRLAEVEAAAAGVAVHLVSAASGDGVEALAPYLAAGETAAFLGSSGVGKSTLINRLLGHTAQKVSEVRVSDSRGRHTTTHREIFLLPGGGLLLDTPGLRELEVWAGESGLSSTFEDIEEVSLRCKFRDCRHQGEPGCAVAEAVSSGALDPERLESYRKLERELRYQVRRRDAAVRAEENERNKAIHRQMRKFMKRNPKGLI
jgi:ribosome biogenesis GTPase